jgi:hypothetical protein
MAERAIFVDFISVFAGLTAWSTAILYALSNTALALWVIAFLQLVIHTMHHKMLFQISATKIFLD